MTDKMVCPVHVPIDRARAFEWDYLGSLGGLYARMDALHDDAGVVWLQPENGPGFWLLTSEEEIRRAFREPVNFSNRMGRSDDVPMMIPLMLDPPEHTAYRRLLQPLFSKGAVASLEPAIRRRFQALLEGVRGRGRCDFVEDIAIRYPTEIFTEWMGLPEEETSGYVALVAALIHGTSDERAAAVLDLHAGLGSLIAQRLASPGDDLMSNITRLEIDGRPVTADELVRIAFLLFIAGLDTVVAALSLSMAHLAQTVDDRRALVDGTVSTDRAIEELLRRHAFVNVPRKVAQDVVVDGVTLRQGDSLVLSTTLASRDPDVLTCPFDVDFERDAAHNFAFGLGTHHCLGAHLARLEMRVALDEWHAVIPDYELDGDPEAYGGFVMGLTHLPLRW